MNTWEHFLVGNFAGLWVDDIRPIPEHLSDKWTSAKSAWEALLKLELIEFEELSLDHDLNSFVGNVELTGYDIALWLAERKQQGFYVPKLIYVHSANPVGVERIQGVIDRYLTNT